MHASHKKKQFEYKSKQLNEFHDNFCSCNKPYQIHAMQLWISRYHK